MLIFETNNYNFEKIKDSNWMSTKTHGLFIYWLKMPCIEWIFFENKGKELKWNKLNLFN